MVQKDLILDFNLYLCEKFGYRESCSVMSHANGFCVDIRERDLDCYIRFWEYSCGRDVYKRQVLTLSYRKRQ